MLTKKFNVQCVQVKKKSEGTNTTVRDYNCNSSRSLLHLVPLLLAEDHVQLHPHIVVAQVVEKLKVLGWAHNRGDN